MDQILLVEDDTAMAESLVYALEAEQFAVRCPLPDKIDTKKDTKVE